MPHEFALGAFEPGDDDMGDFMLDRWLPFARDDCDWVDNQAPVVGTRPNIEVWTHRGTESNPTAPFALYHTSDRHMHIFAADDIDVGEEIYDQPNNPANAPRNTAFTIPTAGPVPNPVGNSLKCSFLNSAVGPYIGYWLFCDTSGSYIHCVLKVSAREYRHFHIGLLQQIDGGVDLDPSSYYVTGHFWATLDPEALDTTFSGGSTTDQEHSAYNAGHRLPFRGNGYQDGSFGSYLINSIPSSRFYMPGLSTHTYDWYHPADGDDLTGIEGDATKAVGTVGTPATIGICQTNFYDAGLGSILYQCDRNFTANANVLVPIFVGVNFDFQTANRLGLVARVPDVFRINMRDYAPEEEITVGGETYKVFPMINKDSQNVLDGEGYSAFEGIAYRVETGPVV